MNTKHSCLLGIESSCDETAVAVLRDGRTVLSSLIASQVDEHRVFGGVVPEVASRSHLRSLPSLYRKSIDEAGITAGELTGIVVTQGPGLIGSLLVGATFAKGLSLSLGIPLIPVNHVHAHIHGALLSDREFDAGTFFPALALVVSGGHTHIYRMNSPTALTLMAYSLDDACGESFDKVAKLLGLGYPGGPKIEELAKSGRRDQVKVPRMIEAKHRLHLSYSGLKTFVYTWLQKHKASPDPQARADLAAAFQDEALSQICRKSAEILSSNPDIRNIVVAGGVAANLRFRELMSNAVANLPIKPRIIFPELKYCSDNGAMIAALGFHLLAAEAQKASHRGADTRKSDRGAAEVHSTTQDLSWDAFPRYPYPTESSHA